MGIYLPQPHYGYRIIEWWSRKKSENALFRHSGESRNPAFSRVSGCRIKSGMTD